MRSRCQLGSGPLSALRPVLRLALWVVGLAVLLAVLFLRAPPERTEQPPQAQDTLLVRWIVTQTVAALRQPDVPQTIFLTRQQLGAVERLAGHGLSAFIARGTLVDTGLTVRLWVRTPLPWRWNHVPLEATILAPSPGVTITGARIGALPLPGALAEWLLDTALARAFPNAARPLDQLVPAIARPRADAVVLTVVAPPGLEAPLRQRTSATLFGVQKARVAALVSVLDAIIYRAPEPVPFERLTQGLFAAVLSRADAGGDIVEDSRAAWVALAAVTVNRKIIRLIEGVPMSEGAEVAPAVDALLAGRTDLSKHLALSAALAVLFEDRFSHAAGEWKELNDSLPGGSGFSFVDLAADRAGVRLAAAARQAQTARAVALALARADDAALFGINAPQVFAEGLSADQFAQGYGSIDSTIYREKIGRIDTALETLPLYRLTQRPSP